LGDEADRADLGSRPAEKGTRLERRAIGREVDERRPRSGPHHLDEAEAVHRRPLGRGRKIFGENRINLLPRLAALERRKVDAGRAADIEAANGAARPAAMRCKAMAKSMSATSPEAIPTSSACRWPKPGIF
jgi:hypothetical protein